MKKYIEFSVTELRLLREKHGKTLVDIYNMDKVDKSIMETPKYE